MIVETKQTIWTNEKGTELVKLLPDSGQAHIAPAYCSPDMLDDLAEACCKASEALRLIAETREHAEAGA